VGLNAEYKTQDTRYNNTRYEIPAIIDLSECDFLYICKFVIDL